MTVYQKENFFALTIFALIIFIDQLIKYNVIVSYDYILNKGFVFGLISSNTVAIIVSLILILLVLYILFFRKIALFPLTVLLGGLVSNVIDRFFYKGVIDYWDFFGLINYNLSDLLIVLMIVLALVVLIWGKGPTKNFR